MFLVPFFLVVVHLHPGRLTWSIQITHLERKMIFQTPMIMFHVNLPGCTVKVKLVWVGLFDSKGWVLFLSGELADTSHQKFKGFILDWKKNRLIEKEGLTSFRGQRFDGPYPSPVPPAKFSSSGDLLFSLKHFPGLFNEPLLLGQTNHVQVGKFMKKVRVGKTFCKCWPRFETAVNF